MDGTRGSHIWVFSNVLLIGTVISLFVPPGGLCTKIQFVWPILAMYIVSGLWSFLNLEQTFKDRVLHLDFDMTYAETEEQPLQNSLMKILVASIVGVISMIPVLGLKLGVVPCTVLTKAPIVYFLSIVILLLFNFGTSGEGDYAHMTVFYASVISFLASSHIARGAPYILQGKCSSLQSCARGF